MTPLLLQRLDQLEMLMRDHQHWQTTPPSASALASSQPFCLDTLEPLEWLQWVLIPRMRALIAARQPLPQNFAVAPYFEVALASSTPGHAALLRCLTQLDALFSDETS
ncbi:YqcC family protein [Candidatus Pantoea deserta]|uniref:YqcC family protein n=1 Tax=Candidatus Pantoea deserta TaxID=1869313 RepID=A0A3N4PG60_9GAMM|nr:YqcC family protein [Pantoea deserta]RPE03477.1 YqcC family protein [Pantoea deserta]